MRPVLLIDFGSTYTKVTAVDLETEELLGTSQSWTTINTDIGEGLAKAVAKLEEKTGPLNFEARYACSSAAGGLRMITSGLVPELTAEAAKQASLGAGAKIRGVYSFELTEDDIEDIDAEHPDIFLLTGGTDGGNKDCILHNAEMLATCKTEFPIVIAGNRSVARTCARKLEGREIHIVENVMPKFGTLNIKPAQDKIREIFLKRIVEAKGYTKAQELIDNIAMPTPSAMMQAMQLLAEGCEDADGNHVSGIGDLVAVDVGGATTDIYSVCDGMPLAGMDTVFKGLPEPYIKRTVEGDIGMRYSIHGIEEAVGTGYISDLSGISEERCRELIDYLGKNTEVIPGGDNEAELEALDFALASGAIKTAVTRHAGRLEEFYTMNGLAYMQTGKDLRGIRQIIVTGGSLIHTKRTGKIASAALWDPQDPFSLKPKQADVWVDRSYILAAMGLLSAYYPQTALKIMKKELKKDGYQE